jgi:transcriptional regulator with XRE-family HTH domain
MGINNIATKLKRLRLNHNYTQEYVANQIGVSRKWYGMMESGEAEPKEENISSIAQFYNVTVEDIKNFDEKNIFTNHVTGSNNNFNQGYYFYQTEQTIDALRETIAVQKQQINLLKETIISLKKK